MIKAETSTRTTPFKESLRAFKQGKPTKAYAIFLSDHTSNPATSFKSFCEGMNRVLISHKLEPFEIETHETTDKQVAELLDRKWKLEHGQFSVFRETLNPNDHKPTYRLTIAF